MAILSVLAIACEAPSVGPDIEPAFAKSGGPACVAPATVVVSDEAGLRSAVAGASSGDIIAIDGMIKLASVNIWFDRPGITVTCATRGSGIGTAPGWGGFSVTVITEPNVTIAGLTIDGSDAGRPLLVTNTTNPLANAADPVLRDNHFICGTSSCVLSSGVSGVTIEGNTMLATQQPNSGFHIQGNGPYLPDGSREGSARDVRVVRNTITTELESRAPGFGGIRLHSVIGAVVSHNQVIGPWQNSFAPTQTWDLVASGNRLAGAVNYGIGSGFNTNPLAGVSVQRSTFRNNQVSGAGVAGGLFLSACGNALVGNQLHKNGDGTSMIFDIATGANTLVGGGGTVIDNGSFDCDGDGTADPNIVGGAGAVLNGVSLGGLVSASMSDSDAGAN